MEFIESFLRLRDYCEREDYRGWDPYDGLNSKVFQALPLLKHSAVARLCVIQGFKRCPVNLRRLALVPKEHNAKGIGLFLQGYCNLYRVAQQNPDMQRVLGGPEELVTRIKKLADLLINMRSEGNYHGACWGYNFDWQARRLFFFPKHTPTVVATSFCATALMDAYEVTGNKNFLEVALSAADFVMKDLHTKQVGHGILFSYSPLQGNDTVINASLLGSRLLCYCYKYTGNRQYLIAAKMSVKACCELQRDDGAWVYGLLPVQSWIDSFHTGYNLDGLAAYEEVTGDTTFRANMDKGLDFYVRNFFEADGTPKYYHDRMYPIDIHCPGQLMVTLSRLGRFGEHGRLAKKVMAWSISHMQDKKGYFYYQKKRGVSSHIPYMRWSNAFMFNAMSYYLLSKCETKEQP